MSTDSVRYPAPFAARLRNGTRLGFRVTQLLAFPELLGLLGLTAVLNLWNLGINGWANTYYSAAVRSMSTSWHDFLFASLDKSGLMTVDKPPLSLWVQALSVRVFGYHPSSILVPEAVTGIVAVGLLYDLVRRRFGRPAGLIAGFVLATTPIVVAVSRHNNPDELLLLCSVAALWAALRALDTGRTRWLVLSGICVGLGFETKMGVALLVVPGIAAAWMWARSAAPGGWLRALRQLLAGGVAMVAVAGAWPLLVTLTPAADRPWISGTSDNSIWSLIFGYNGLGRVAGQSGGPGGGGAGGGGTLLGGATGPFRLLQSGLGDQGGWLLGFAVVAGLGLLALTRLRRRDPRTGWLIAIGGALASSAIVFSFSRGIFHPYYVSFLAPFAAALIGAGAAVVLARDRSARVLAPLTIGAGMITELVVLNGIGGQLSWAKPLVIAVAAACAVILALRPSPRMRAVFVGVALAALLAAPATWAAETLGHATSGTFPTGGPTSASVGGPGGGPGGGTRGQFGGAGFAVGPPGGFGAGAPGGAGAGRTGAGGPGGFGGDSSTLTAAISYASAHGGGTIGVSSQSGAASLIISSDANVAGLGGFSGRESSVSATWVAQEVASGHLRWILADSTQSARLPGDTRTGSAQAMSIVSKTCRAVTFSTSTGSKVTMYDCQGRASAILAAARA